MNREFSVFKSSLRSIHNWILLSGAALGLGVYLPTLISLSATVVVSGMSHLILNSLLIALAVRQLRRHRKSVQEISIEDQWLGSGLILGGLAIFYFYYPAVTPQSLSCMIILVGGVLSYQGLPFLRQQWAAIALLMLSLHPNLERVARHLWSIVAHPQALSKWMAWGGGELLKVIGQPVSIQEQFIVLPAGTVEVASGCDGFEMSFVMLMTALIMGIVFRVRSRMMLALIAIGISLALVMNVCRIAVMVLAAVYWGKDAFEFWHGTVGGQIFSGILFTIYYYATQPLLNAQK
ncbi:MAG: cyanoexosortase C [Leptolyngbya sp. Prado105]|jgi:exosortase|nr:cyanoexosortase C [Leptolyngbya sp. Prado105]